jgi:hypothetical protein
MAMDIGGVGSDPMMKQVYLDCRDGMRTMQKEKAYKGEEKEDGFINAGIENIRGAEVEKQARRLKARCTGGCGRHGEMR